MLNIRCTKHKLCYTKLNNYLKLLEIFEKFMRSKYGYLLNKMEHDKEHSISIFEEKRRKEINVVHRRTQTDDDQCQGHRRSQVQIKATHRKPLIFCQISPQSPFLYINRGNSKRIQEAQRLAYRNCNSFVEMRIVHSFLY